MEELKEESKIICDKTLNNASGSEASLTSDDSFEALEYLCNRSSSDPNSTLFKYLRSDNKKEILNTIKEHIAKTKSKTPSCLEITQKLKECNVFLDKSLLPRFLDSVRDCKMHVQSPSSSTIKADASSLSQSEDSPKLETTVETVKDIEVMHGQGKFNDPKVFGKQLVPKEDMIQHKPDHLKLYGNSPITKSLNVSNTPLYAKKTFKSPSNREMLNVKPFVGNSDGEIMGSFGAKKANKYALNIGPIPRLNLFPNPVVPEKVSLGVRELTKKKFSHVTSPVAAYIRGETLTSLSSNLKYGKKKDDVATSKTTDKSKLNSPFPQSQLNINIGSSKTVLNPESKQLPKKLFAASGSKRTLPKMAKKNGTAERY